MPIQNFAVVFSGKVGPHTGSMVQFRELKGKVLDAGITGIEDRGQAKISSPCVTPAGNSVKVEGAFLGVHGTSFNTSVGIQASVELDGGTGD
jgi:hypothetical protein